MRLTVLGRYGPFPAAGGACSGYLLEHDGTRVLLECGAGVFSRLIRVCDIEELTGVVLSHLHFDHASDMPVLRYALESLHKRGKAALPLTVYAPDAPADGFALIDRDAFAVQPLGDGVSFDLGAIRVTAHRVVHPVPTFAFTFTASDGATLFYTGDTAYFDKLAALASGADVILADACHLERGDAGGQLNHMTARQAGRVAQAAHAKELLLTHVWGGGYTDAEMMTEVGFSAASVVQEGAQYDLTSYKGERNHGKKDD